jgi:hypothetical protein
MVTDEVTKAMQGTASDTWGTEFPRQLRYYLDRERRRASR